MTDLTQYLSPMTPPPTAKELVAWAIVLAPHPSTREWAEGWLSGEDRSADAAYATWKMTQLPEKTPGPMSLAGTAARAAWAAAAVEAEVGSPAWESIPQLTEWPLDEVEEVVVQVAGSRLMPAFARARAILRGELPASAAWELMP